MIDTSTPLLQVENLTISFPSDAGPVPVVKQSSFSLGQEIVALVGESGSGKSMTGRAIMGLLTRRAMVTADRLTFEGRDLTGLGEKDWNRLRGSGMALVLQDPKYSLNPALRVGYQVEEALKLHTHLSARERKARALEMMHQVGLVDPERVYGSTPRQLSGGMGQRVMIAAMLINRPKLLIADEPTSALDHDLQVQILELLRRLARDMGMSVLLISHDLRQVSQFADRVLVMRHGHIVDRLPAAQLAEATHPYTRNLWAARPSAATFGTHLPVIDDAMDEQP